MIVIKKKNKYPRKSVPHSSPFKILEIVSGWPPAAITTAGTPPLIALYKVKLK